MRLPTTFLDEWARALILFLGIMCSSSCTDSEKVRAALEERYPSGSSRAEITKSWGQPERVISIAESQEAFISGIVDRARQSTGKDARSCEIYSVFRKSAGSSFGAVGLYEDYILYDQDGRVVQAFRRLLD